MDDRDQSRGPFEEDLRPAVRRLDIKQDDPAPTSTVDPSDLAGPTQRIESAIVPVWIMQAAISAAILGSIVGGAFRFFSIASQWYGGLVFATFFFAGVIHSVLRYRIWRFRLREDSLYLERGVFRRVRTVVPYVRIQHVDVSRGPVERIFGLATTVVYTAGSRGADVSIPGLSPDRADDLQTRLKQLAIAAEGDDAV